MATSYPTLSLPAGWTDIAAEQAGIASAAGTTIQNVGQQTVRVFFGGAQAPADANAGHVLGRFDGYYDKNGSANIWVKGPGHIALSKD